MLKAPAKTLATAIAACSLLLGACAATPQADAELAGNWQLRDFKLTNSNQTRLIGLEPFSMNLTGNGEATGRLDCNTWRGRYEDVTDSTFALRDMVLVQGRCGHLASNIDMLERVFPEFLEGEATYTIEGREMILETSRGDRLRFEATHRRSGDS